MLFRDRNAHGHHPWLQVRSIANQKVINANEVEHFLGDNACKIQKYVDNGSEIYKLKTKEWTAREGKTIVQPNDVICGGCDSSISKATTTKEVEVCSIECLIKLADRKQQLRYLALRDGVNLWEPYVFPMTTSEKRVHKYEIRVPMPLRLLKAPGPQHNANNTGDDVKMEPDSGAVAKMEDGYGPVDMEIDENDTVESELVYDFSGVVLEGQ